MIEPFEVYEKSRLVYLFSNIILLIQRLRQEIAMEDTDAQLIQLIKNIEQSAKEYIEDTLDL